LVAVLLTTLGLALVGCGCSNSSKSGSGNAWCRLVKQHNEVFNTTKKTPKALAAFGKIAAQAPTPIRADIQTVFNEVMHIAQHDARYLYPPYLTQWTQAKGRVDAYLKTECGVTPPTTSQSA
jgi:hypothetical protein